MNDLYTLDTFKYQKIGISIVDALKAQVNKMIPSNKKSLIKPS